jgi:hypothetical protein
MVRLTEALLQGAVCCVLAAGCRMGYEDALAALGGAGKAADSGGSSGFGASGGTLQPAGAGDTATPTDGGATGMGGGTGSMGGSDVIGASGETSAGGTSSAGGTTASGGTGGVSGSAASDAGGAAGDASGGVSATGGTSASGGMSASGGLGGASGTGGGGGFAGASSLGDCMAQTYGTRDYLFCNVKVPWAQARDNCASIGMVLARVDDAGEDQFLSDNGYISPPVTSMWIGASDGAVEGEWRWVDGELFWLGDRAGSAQNGLYAGWYAGLQPSAQKAERDCAVHEVGSTAGWYDSDCTFSKEYVCESP